MRTMIRIRIWLESFWLRRREQRAALEWQRGYFLGLKNGRESVGIARGKDGRFRRIST